MVSVLYFRTSVQGSSPGRGYCGMFLGETPYSHCAQVYKWVPVNLLLPGGGRNTPSRLSGKWDELWPD